MGRVLLTSLRPGELDALFARTEFFARTPHTVTDPATLRGLVGEVQRDGYAVVDQELEVGLRSIAVPVRNQSGRILSPMNTSGHAARTTADDLRQRVQSGRGSSRERGWQYV